MNMIHRLFNQFHKSHWVVQLTTYILLIWLAIELALKIVL
jgi:hypothetical protein